MKRALTEAWGNLTRDSERTVGFPLYRILALFLLPPSIIQLSLQRPPESIQESTPEWYNSVFIVVQLVGALLVIVSLAMKDTIDANRLERVAAWILGWTGVIYTIALWSYVWPSPPITTPSWLYIGFSVFCFVRVFQITKKLREFERRVAETEG